MNKQFKEWTVQSVHNSMNAKFNKYKVQWVNRPISNEQLYEWTIEWIKTSSSKIVNEWKKNE